MATCLKHSILYIQTSMDLERGFPVVDGERGSGQIPTDSLHGQQWGWLRRWLLKLFSGRVRA